ncbi:thiamine pyrophosphate-binding protein [Promethearchaeum syntrophicum]|uniref:sulfopyruvate decarboxylase n=1 Tax=Promethearchaeum syntrophicum TaxID=2594042 RepID=A0A5B9DFG3_9ARCH|nr:thiamine pyrophosphate-binding protein [Candidatus Prometheoarchaeum syntrophicum]QEE18028.1 Sulfopyruvate decarboxylase subunit alpha [Candidatus Prometheoarchaeum syntrophicum]
MWEIIDPKLFLKILEENNFSTITGVPCSYFKDLLIYLDNEFDQSKIKHILATREDQAVGIASGVAFTNRKAIVYLQNSGLGNIGDALTSLAQLYKLPMLLLISYRGLLPDRDFPEHSIMGEVTEDLLNALKVPYKVLEIEEWQKTMQEAIDTMEKLQLPVALLVQKGVLSQ